MIQYPSIYIRNWEKAYSIAETKLTESEREWLNSKRPKSTDDAEETLGSLISMAEDSQKRMVDKQWKLPDRNGRLVPVRDRVEKILQSIDKYSCIVDAGVQHSPEIRFVLISILQPTTTESLTIFKRAYMGWYTLCFASVLHYRP